MAHLTAAVDIALQIDTVPYPIGTRGDMVETIDALEALERRIA